MRRRFAISLIALFSLLLSLVGLPFAQAAQDDQASFLSAFHWQLTNTWFGGFSALEVSEDGGRMVALSDRGVWVEADLKRQDGEIIGAENVRMSRVLHREGHFAKHTKWRDSEGVARLADGSLVVSFEGEHRLESFSFPGAKPHKMPWHNDFDAMSLNGGFEALAVDARGVLYAIPEAAVGAENMIQIFALRNRVWTRAFTLPRNKQFQPVGADFGPDGRLYVLERGFNGLGFRTRVRSFEVESGDVRNEKLLFSKGIAQHDNLEGISVWRDEDGAIRLTMISDDNFRFLQKTEIVEYVLPVSP
ncbi:esterase-like activity of phytase family protein [Shimia haliotis]|uniref:Phytase-like domain-containing protein n=1 Tax=Shimia haliotis TaxID=1280847 RepID=A0A1I4DHQ6_9RHOB|nr:esterase-like activity of phytase family protein [Shimia haliotis]SFK92007.1 hypothetical protein SAMN04488036_103124 [Shimia haliotis]